MPTAGWPAAMLALAWLMCMGWGPVVASRAVGRIGCLGSKTLTLTLSRGERGKMVALSRVMVDGLGVRGEWVA